VEYHRSMLNQAEPLFLPAATASRSRSSSRRACALALTCALLSVGVTAESSERAEMQSLDGQVQEIKSDVLRIAAELKRLEEKLLYPSDTQVAIFVSLDQGEGARLDSVRLEIDGEFVTQHLYSFKELEALQKGGVQRIYTGNVTRGAHRLDVVISGQLPSGKSFDGQESFVFDKAEAPKLVGLTLGTELSGGPNIRIAGW
jgi:hypothetical protein